MPASPREFVFSLGAFGTFARFSLDRTEPELILYNGNFWTVNPRQPRAQAVVDGSRFGTLSSDQVSYPSRDARSIDSLGSFMRVSYFRIRDIAIDLVLSCSYM